MNPGSPEAVKAGCCCPVLDNHHGAGISLWDGTIYWWKSADCPLHGADAEESPNHDTWEEQRGER